jgi:hypothetical protein
VDVPALIALWLDYAKSGRIKANGLRRNGDFFGAELCVARAAVRQEAAQLLRRNDDPVAAAALMLRRAAQLWLPDLPFVGFDEAAIDYTSARTWQGCARTIDPSLPVVQKRLIWK